MEGNEMSETVREKSPDGSYANELQAENEVSSGEAFSEELVEMILAMVPFPFLFKARVLSKAWLARLSSISSLKDHNEEQKRAAASFQKQVLVQCTNWKTFCPLGLGTDGLSGYDRTTHTWRRIASLSFFPSALSTVLLPDFLHRFQVEGALVLIANFQGRTEPQQEVLYVANILTRTWKLLPPRPHVYGRWGPRPEFLNHKKLVSVSSDAYKVIFVSYDFSGSSADGGNSLIMIYDSKTAAWTRRRLILAVPHLMSALPAYLNEVFYIQVYPGPCTNGLPSYLRVVAVNSKDETLEELRITNIENTLWSPNSHAHQVVCNGNLLLVVTIFDVGCCTARRLLPSWDSVPPSYTFMKVDLVSRQLVQIASGSSHLDHISLLSVPVSDGVFIFLGVNWGSCQLLAYNVHENRCTSFPFYYESDTFQLICSSYQPGLNPFVEV